MIDNCTQIPTTLQCEDHVKYLGVLLDSNLSWKFQINNVALKISRTVGVVARFRHFVPRTTLLNIYQSLILPYLTYGLAAWVKLPKPIYKKFSCFKNEEAEDDYVEVPILLQKMANSASSTQCTNNRQVLLVVNLIVISFCKTIYFVTLACFSVILIYQYSLFNYFTTIILSVMTAVISSLRPPRLAFAICWWRWQNDVHEIKYSVCV